MALDNRTVTGADRLKTRITTIRNNLALPLLVNEIGALLLRRVKARFDKGVTADGEQWPPHSTATRADIKRKGVRSRGLLRRTDEMRNAIQLIRGSVAGTIFTNTGGGVRIGIRGDIEVVTKGRVHNRGLPSRKIPARRFLQVGSSDVSAVDGLMRRKSQTILG